MTSIQGLCTRCTAVVVYKLASEAAVPRDNSQSGTNLLNSLAYTHAYYQWIFNVIARPRGMCTFNVRSHQHRRPRLQDTGWILLIGGRCTTGDYLNPALHLWKYHLCCCPPLSRHLGLTSYPRTHCPDH